MFVHGYMSGRYTDSWKEIVVFNLDFPSDASSVKFRAVQWICTEVLLALACIVNLLPREYSALRRIIPD